MEIKGHPELPTYAEDGTQVGMITVCAGCERIRTILFLSGDRWFCTACREEGDARPTQIPLSNPARSR